MYNTIFMSTWRDGVGVGVWTNYNVHLCLQTTLTLTIPCIFFELLKMDTSKLVTEKFKVSEGSDL